MWVPKGGGDTGLSVDGDGDVDDGDAIDADADGYAAPDDCDDSDPLVNLMPLRSATKSTTTVTDRSMKVDPHYYPDADMDEYGDDAAPSSMRQARRLHLPCWRLRRCR